MLHNKKITINVIDIKAIENENIGFISNVS
jgi:hypothetical protein